MNEPAKSSAFDPLEVGQKVQATVTSLTSAIHSARVESAERSQVVAELRGAETARLEMLHEAITPLLAEVPRHIDLFDSALAPGEHPRLFIDMIGFVEMARDRRTYRFLQDTRHGRVQIAQAERIEPMVDAIRTYIARRMVERESALASDQTIEQAAKAYAAKTHVTPSVAEKQSAAGSPLSPPTSNVVTPFAIVTRKRRPVQALLRFVVEFLGVFALTGLLLIAAINAYTPVRDWLAAHLG